MDQETGSVRRRSSRLAARGITTTPKAETIVKKTAKSSEKPKRTKRKPTEEVIELPEAKKTKTDDELDEKLEDSKEVETNNVEKNVSAVITPMDVDNVVKTYVSPPSSVKNNNALQTAVEKTDDTSLEDSKEEEKVCVKTSSEIEKDQTAAPSTDDKVQPEVAKEPIQIIEPEKNEVSQKEREQEPVALDNTTTNGDDDDKGKVELMVETVKKDIGFIVAAKDTVTAKDAVTPNGNIVDQTKATNGDDKPVAESEAIEPTKVLNDNTNHVVETDLKAITINTAAITASNDTLNVEQVGKEVEAKVVDDNTVDNASVLAGDNAPSAVDQTSNLVS